MKVALIGEKQVGVATYSKACLSPVVEVLSISTLEYYPYMEDCMSAPVCHKCRGKGYIPGIRKGKSTMIRCKCK